MKKFLSLLLAVAVCFTAFISTGFAGEKNNGLTEIKQDHSALFSGEEENVITAYEEAKNYGETFVLTVSEYDMMEITGDEFEWSFLPKGSGENEWQPLTEKSLSLTIENFSLKDEGIYRCLFNSNQSIRFIVNLEGTVPTVNKEVQIPINGEYTLRAVEENIEGLSYQWSYFEEAVAEFYPNPIEGATDNQLEIKKFSQYKAGYYCCEITCDGRRVGLSRFHVTVKPVEGNVPAWPDEIYYAEENTVENFAPSLGETIRLEATKEKIKGITYQWYLEEGYVENNEDLSNPIQGEMGNSLEIKDFSKEDCGFYVCELNNGNEIRRYRAEVTLDTGLEVVGEPTDYPNISRMTEEQEHIECERGNYTVIKILPEDLGKEIALNSLAQNADEELLPVEYQWMIYDRHDGEYQKIEEATSSSYKIELSEELTNKELTCEVSDGFNFCTSYFLFCIDTGLSWQKRPDATIYADVGDSLTLEMAAVTDHEGETLHYEMCREFNDELIYSIDSDSGAAFEIDGVEENMYGQWYYSVTDERGNISKGEFHIASKSGGFRFEKTEFAVAPGDDLHILGEVTVKKNEGFEELSSTCLGIYRHFDNLDNAGNFYDSFGLIHRDFGVIDDFGSWGLCGYDNDYLYDDTAINLEIYDIRDDEIFIRFTIDIENIQEEMDGVHAISARNTSNEVQYLQDITIHVRDFSQNVVETDEGYKLEGVLHPSTELIIENMADTDAYALFKNSLNDKEKIISAVDMALRANDLANAYKGKLNLYIPVDEKYHGKTMQVLIYDKTPDERDVGTAKRISVKAEDGALKIEDISAPSAIAVLENTEETSAKPEQPDDDNPNKDDDKTEVDTQKPDGDNPNKDDGKTESELQKPQKPGGNIQTDGKDAEATDHTPKTADESMLLEMVLVFLASLGASVCILVYDKKEKQ